MLTKFWDAIGGKLADRWAAVSVPALLYWLAGVLAWMSRPGGVEDVGRVLDSLGQQPAPIQVGVLVALLFAIIGSGELVALLTMPALRLAEGYWPAFLEPLSQWLVRRVERRVSALDVRFQRVAGVVADGTASQPERVKYVRLDRQLRRFPADGAYLPTRVGNILRAAERRPTDKYGLDAIVVWPHFWLLMPSTTQTELAAAYRSLRAAVAGGLWGLLLLAFAVWSWWAVVVGLSVAVIAHHVWLPSRAEVFADLLEAAFDLHRTSLYAQLRWPLPANPGAEREVGRRITAYLWRGLDGDTPTFLTPGSSKSP